MTKLKLHTPDLTAANIDRIAALFPNCVTETKDGAGKPKRAIDFDLLRQELSETLVEGPQERYRLDWPGKREALALANQPITKTLRPCREESVDFENTRNLYIEGDNLDALKLLQETYLGKVKMIYIDPPYNTGNDFIYDDNFSMNRSEYEELSGDRDEEGNAMFDAEKWKQNSSASGRFHSEWLSMMYARIKLAKNLLSDDGVIFVSIDDGEVANLRRILDDVFGESNFVANVIWQKKYAVSSDAKGIPPLHDHILTYQKSAKFVPMLLPRTEKQDAIYKNPDNDPRGLWRPDNLTRNEYRERDCYPITSPKTGKVFYPPKGSSWRHPKDAVEKMIAENRIWFGMDGNSRPAPKRFLNEVRQGIVASAWWPFSEVGHNDESKKELLKIFEGNSPFGTPKPTRLIDRMLRLVTQSASDSIILDFFSGSATTAHAVMQLNAEDGGKRRHIMVQLPEPCDEKSEAFKAGYKTIAEIGKERIRRAGQKILQEWQAKQAKETPAQGDLLESNNQSPITNNPGAAAPDIGFRVLKIADSNFREIERTPEELDQKELALHTEHIKPDRTPEDLLFQVLVDWGVDLALPIVSETLHGKRVFFVDENALAACFDTGLSDELVHAIAARKPLRAVFRDDGFGDDSTRINVEQIFKLLSPGTEVKAL